MKTFNDLSQTEKNEVASRAQIFRLDHAKIVNQAIKIADAAFAPSGSDLFRPELWKPGHWKWFDLGGNCG